MQQKHSNRSTNYQFITDFVTNFVYENGQLAHVNTPEGRIVYNTNGTIRQEFNLKDHLGNVRVVYSVENGVVTTRQIDNYYPFGYNIKGLSVNKYATTRTNEYLYNGKMMQDEMGLNWLDYGARMYDAVLGRWHSVDPMEQYISGYVYCGNNPIMKHDPSGMFSLEYSSHQLSQNGKPNMEAIATTFIDPTGRVIWHIDDDDNQVYLVEDIVQWVRTGMTKNGLQVVGWEDPNKTYRNGDQYEFYIPWSYAMLYKYYMMMKDAIDFWNSFFGGPEGEDVSTSDKLYYHISWYAAGKIFVTIKGSNGPYRKQIEVPKGYTPIKTKSRFNAPVFKKNNTYISPDITEHNTEGWKVAYDKPENLLRKETRAGTYDITLTNKIGD